MPRIEHNLSGIIAALCDKIAALESAKMAVKNQIEGGKSVALNMAALEEICESLEAAENGKMLLMNSCCNGQNCEFEFYEN